MSELSNIMNEWARELLMREAMRREAVIKDFLQSGAFLNELSSIQTYSPLSWRIE